MISDKGQNYLYVGIIPWINGSLSNLSGKWLHTHETEDGGSSPRKNSGEAAVNGIEFEYSEYLWVEIVSPQIIDLLQQKGLCGLP